MGNVLATSGPLPPPPPPEISQYPSGFAKTPVSRDGTSTAEEKLENPGCMEDLHKKCKDVFPTCFEGAKLMVNKGLSSHFQVSHTVNMSSVTPSGYRFGATYVGTKQISPTEAFPVLLGDIDPSGNLNANIIHQFGQQIRCKFASQVQGSKFTASQMSTDYRGEDYTATVTLGNPNIINNSGVVVLHYLQTIIPRFSLGTELAYQWGSAVPYGEVAVLSAAAKYATENWVLSGTLGQGGIHACFWQKASSQLQLGVEIETNFRTQESTTTIAYQVDLPRTDLIFRGMVDSNWNVGAVFEKKLQPLPFTFALSGTMNHNKSQFRLGAGVIIG